MSNPKTIYAGPATTWSTDHHVNLHEMEYRLVGECVWTKIKSGNIENVSTACGLEFMKLSVQTAGGLFCACGDRIKVE